MEHLFVNILMREVYYSYPHFTDKEAEARRRYQGRHRMKGVGQEVWFWYLFSASFLSSLEWGPQSGLQPLNFSLKMLLGTCPRTDCPDVGVHTAPSKKLQEVLCVHCTSIHKAPVCLIPLSRRRGKKALWLLPVAAWVPRAGNGPEWGWGCGSSLPLVVSTWQCL